jgi:hypothetical protein
MAAERLALLQRSWSLVADQYHLTFSPLFFPWIQDTLSVLTANSPPPGVIAVPCCGPGERFGGASWCNVLLPLPAAKLLSAAEVLPSARAGNVVLL